MTFFKASFRPIDCAIARFPLARELLVVAVSSCGFLSCSQKAEAPKKTTETGPAQSVQTIPVQAQPMERIVTVTGSFDAREQSTLTVKVPGRLQSVTVDVGSVVIKGDLLAQIDRTDYELRAKQAEAALAQARARLGLTLEGDDENVAIDDTGTVREARAVLVEAEKNRKRVRDLARDKISSPAELDTVEAAYTVATNRYQTAKEDVRERLALALQRRAELNLARRQFADCNVYSPFDGIVQQRRASIGEFLQTGTPLLVVADVDPLRLRLEIPERESLPIRAGQPVRVTIGQSSNVYTAEIARVSPMLSQSNRMLAVEADVPSRPELRPGLFAQASIIVSKEDLALSVPESAIAVFVGLEKVFIVQNGKALEKSVRTGRRNAGVVEILSGVKSGDRVILNPTKLRSGQAVIEEVHAKAR
jgi:RND family efflux transporter MFP subunit